MFELSVIRKYLIPSKRQLSASLIAALSFIVISIVVWLVLLFLSITEGLEKNWVEKLTTLNAPVRITPTREYFNSYYYLADSIAEKSHYTFKTLSEKIAADASDPHNPEVDREVPPFWPKKELSSSGAFIDPVKRMVRSLQTLSQTRNVKWGDYEVTGALLRLQLIRSADSSLHLAANAKQHLITHVSYIATLPEKNPFLKGVLLAPTTEDINQLLFLSSLSPNVEEDPSLKHAPSAELFQSRLKAILSSINIHSLETTPPWKIPHGLLPSTFEVEASARIQNNQVMEVYLPALKSSYYQMGKLVSKNGVLSFEANSLYTLGENTPILSPLSHRLQAEPLASSITSARSLSDLLFTVKGKVGSLPIQGTCPFHQLKVKDSSIASGRKAPWITFTGSTPHLPKDGNHFGILAPKSFKESGTLIGDKGYLSYTSNSINGMQEQRIPIYIAGFYDPGFMATGAKFLFVPKEVVSLINSSNSTLNTDKLESSGIQVYFSNPKDALQVKKEIQELFKNEEISKYWKVQSYHDYDFAKDFLSQFQSDKYLFTLIALIILLVACSNIISFLVILVNDKKKEIGILRALGASSSSVSLIFGMCGITIGVLSCLCGTAAAYLTLHNLDSIIKGISMLQGHDLFNSVFYGESLPNAMSHSALLFVLIATPIISLSAGLIPAIKASRLNPVDTLRGDA